MKEFEDKTVVITGGTKGIGLDIAEAFLEEGAHVFVGSRRDSEAFRERCPSICFVRTDVRSYKQMENLVGESVKQTGHLDVFVNNAGISIWRSLDKVDEKFWSLLVDTNLKGALWGCKAAAGYLKKGGAIINVASLAGKRGSVNNSVYVASKFGMVGITQALSKELGPRGIRVNSICPVYVSTDSLLKNLSGDHPDVGAMKPQEFLDVWAAKNAALGRLPTGRECANLCLFLASERASAITGQNINVDCGVLPQ
ncbi:MAG: SDR family oxidoreductase [Thermodesulfovibrionales bacterium]|nr:SDR family oxidoreductase [Thermodesulfovibrionales bacterium]